MLGRVCFGCLTCVLQVSLLYFATPPSSHLSRQPSFPSYTNRSNKFSLYVCSPFTSHTCTHRTGSTRGSGNLRNIPLSSRRSSDCYGSNQLQYDKCPLLPLSPSPRRLQHLTMPPKQSSNAAWSKATSRGGSSIRSGGTEKCPHRLRRSDIHSLLHENPHDSQLFFPELRMGGQISA